MLPSDTGMRNRWVPTGLKIAAESGLVCNILTNCNHKVQPFGFVETSNSDMDLLLSQI